MPTATYYWRQNVETLFVRSISLPPPPKQSKIEAMTTCTPITSINIGPEERGAAFQQLTDDHSVQLALNMHFDSLWWLRKIPQVFLLRKCCLPALTYEINKILKN